MRTNVLTFPTPARTGSLEQVFSNGQQHVRVDPSPGNVKTLRIHARGPDGRTRMFEYREGSLVDGSMFSGWGGGNWGNKGGEYLILSAQYGVAARHVDVTQRLRQLAAQNSFFRMGNSTFGVDPAPGQVKVFANLCPRARRPQPHVRVPRRQHRGWLEVFRLGKRQLGKWRVEWRMESVPGAASGGSAAGASSRPTDRGESKPADYSVGELRGWESQSGCDRTPTVDDPERTIEHDRQQYDDGIRSRPRRAEDAAS